MFYIGFVIYVALLSEDKLGESFNYFPREYLSALKSTKPAEKTPNSTTKAIHSPNQEGTD